MTPRPRNSRRARWYAALDVGQTRGELYEILERRLAETRPGRPHPDVLPLSDHPAYLPPFLPARERALTVA